MVNGSIAKIFKCIISESFFSFSFESTLEFEDDMIALKTILLIDVFFKIKSLVNSEY